MREDILDSILALLIQLVRDEADYKVKLAHKNKFLLVAAQRMMAIQSFR